jgi:type II secretory pathway component PulF
MLPRNKIPPACWQIWMSQWSELLQSGIPVLDALELSMELQGNGRQSRLLRANLQRSLQFLKTGPEPADCFSRSIRCPCLRRWKWPCCVHKRAAIWRKRLTHKLQRWKKTSTAHQALGKSLIYPVVVLLLAIACWIFLHQVSSPHIHTDKTNMDQSVNTAEILMIVGGLLLLMSGAAHLIGRHQTAGIHWLPHNAWQASDFYHVIACELHAGLDLMHCLRYRAMPANRWLAWTSAGNNPLASLNTLSLLIQRHLKEGLPLSQAMTRAKAPAFLIRQSQLAEQTGNLSHCFSLAAKVYEMQAISAQQRLQSTLPPMALALAAATLAMAYQFTLAPLYANLAGLV